jgi:hypothetical protein
MTRWLTALVVGLAGSAVAGAPPAASAATPPCRVVDTGSNQSYTSFQDAVNAPATSVGDTLFVKGTCTGHTDVSKSLTITGQSNGGQKTTTLNGGGQTSVLTIEPGITVTLNTLVITGGNGGIFNFGTVTLNGSTITGNLNPGGGVGGGIFNRGTVTLNSSTITGNTAGQGGGIYNLQVPGTSATVTLAGSSTITDNTASGGPGAEGAIGGGIFNFCGTLVNAIAPPATDANVYNNNPDNIFSECL